MLHFVVGGGEPGNDHASLPGNSIIVFRSQAANQQLLDYHLVNLRYHNHPVDQFLDTLTATILVYEDTASGRGTTPSKSSTRPQYTWDGVHSHSRPSRKYPPGLVEPENARWFYVITTRESGSGTVSMDGTPGNERFCSQCGAKLKGTSQFCPKCGLPAGGTTTRTATPLAIPGVSFSSPVFMDISYRGQEFAWYWGLRLLAGGVVLVLLGLIIGIASIEMGLFFGILGHFILLPGSVGFFAADYFSRKYDASAVAIAIILLLSLVLLAFRIGWGSYVVFLVISVVAGFIIHMYLKDHPGGA